MLDNSLPGERFFEGTSRAEADTWDEEAGGLLSIGMYFEEEGEEEGGGSDDGEWGEDDSGNRRNFKSLDVRAFDEENNGAGGSMKLNGGEINFQVFQEVMWPRIRMAATTDGTQSASSNELHPSLVYTEIKSYIKGSVEALHSEGGKLSLEAYLALGRKRSDMTPAQRERVFCMFQRYETLRKKRRSWDEGDLVWQLYQRRMEHGRPGIRLHRIVADEVQDFTQAEIQLLILMSEDPNGLVLAGDTAQNINRGVGFRFVDIKTLFHQVSVQCV
jgi:hypothetical protein